MISHGARTDLVALARNPMPSSPIIAVIEAEDGMPLRCVRWDATRTPQRGTVCIVPGRGECIEKYFEVIADLRRRGFAVAILDLRGQGGSGRVLANSRKGYVRDFAEYDRDLALFLREFVLPYCPRPIVGLGHSLGGHILARTATTNTSPFDRMVLSAPMMGFADEKVGFPQSIARSYVETATTLGFGTAYVLGGGNISEEETVPFERNSLSGDLERWTRSKGILEAAPDLGLGSPTNAWVRAAYRSMRRLADPEFAQSVKVPMLIFACGKDRIVSTTAIEEFAAGLKVGALVLFQQSMHEILQERDPIRQRFWATFDAYLGVERTAAA